MDGGDVCRLSTAAARRWANQVPSGRNR